MPDIKLVWGDTNTIKFAVLDEDNAAQAITSGTIRFAIRRRGEQPALIDVACTISDGAGGLCTYAMTAANWAQVRPGTYEGQLKVTFSDSVVARTPVFYTVYVSEQIA